MFRNYMKVAWRTIFKSKIYSLINIGGLGISLAVSILILLFVLHEFSYDRFHSGADQIFRMQGTFQFGEKTFNTLSVSAGTGPSAKNSLPEVEAYVRVFENQSPVFQSGPQHVFREERFMLTEPSFLEVFSFNLLKGNQEEVLTQPQQLLITKSTAKKYFGDQDPIGKTLTMEGQLPFTVEGIIEDAPSNSTIQYDVIGSLNSLTAIERMQNPEIEEDQITLNFDKIGLGNIITYLKLSKEADGEAVAAKITGLANPEDATISAQNTFLLNQFTTVHLKSNFGDYANIRYIYFFLGVALLILLLALVNYISLSTARAIKRAKEVGIRKVNGAQRQDLIRQFYGESALLTLIAFGVGLILVAGLQPYFYKLLDLQIDQSFLLHPLVLSVAFGLLVVSVLVAGSIPAILMSSFSPIKILRGEIASGQGGARMRKAMTLFQFTATLSLICISIFVGRQLNFLQKSSTALLEDEIIELPVNRVAQKGFQAYKNAILEQTTATDLGVSSCSVFGQGMNVVFTKSKNTQEDVPLYFMSVDPNFFKMFNLSWLKSPYDEQKLGAENTIILNEIASNKLGLQEDSLGQANIDLLGGSKEVVGVLESFRFQSLRSQEPALCVFLTKEDNSDILAQDGMFYINFPKGTIMSEQLNKLKNIQAEFEPGQPFAYDFLDETISQFYKSEQRLSTMLGSFTLIAILLSCMGIFGLITYNTERRTKEIGIRKVLGATVPNLVKMLTKDFIIIVLISLFFAIPITYYFLNDWLENFTTQINLSWWVFAIAGITAILLALVTTGFQATRAAVSNPADILRKE